MVWGMDSVRSPRAAKQLRTAGDKARDSGDWEEAAEKYQEYLKSEAEDSAIWVQLGHAFKEQMKYEQAESAYSRAKELEPDDADVHLQLGHLFKILGRSHEAVEAYTNSYEIEPTYAAEAEINALGGVVDEVLIEDNARKYTSENIVYVELDDMLGYLQAHSTVSGIQRVQSEFARFVIEKGCHVDGTQYVFVVNTANQRCVWGLQPDAVLQIIKYTTGSNVDHDYLRRLINGVRASATRIVPCAGQCYIALGAFWGYGSVTARFLHLKRMGLRIGGYIYDLIPINNPEYCDEGVCHDFMLSFGDAMQVFDFILTISDHTASEVVKYREKLGLEPMPVESVRLPHANKVQQTNSDVWTPTIRALKGRNFAMMVSTIEARKNHRYLVDAWRQFYSEGLEPPDLVFVGRFGWRVNDLMNTLKQSRNFGGRLHVLHGLTDGELNKLYKECSFTVFPSYAEGWGLPVGEGLAHGKPCVASMTTSMPEVGGDFVDYVDPWNLRAGSDVLRKMCFDEKYRESRRKNIELNFKVRNWGDFSKNLIEVVGRYHKAKIKARIPQAQFKPGVVFRPSELAFGKEISAKYAANPVRLLLSSSWSTIEHWGVWMLGNHGELEFRTPYKSGEQVIAYIEFVGAPQVDDEVYCTATISEHGTDAPDEQGRKWIQIPRTKPFVVKLEGVVKENGLVVVNVFVRGDIKPENESPHARKFAIGVIAAAYARKSDLELRTDITEELVSGIAQV
ncbi:glycosyltransferase [Burkholderia sp. PAMC 26561]|uniref:glycosyltransferase n=1 Tax=Burkholderia sp. PAMC 26561 TaxID=1795043 RepID=UPI00076B0687|nr:glycosyltransferase [Burkholderia sp. PAMC 26561]AME22896.1 hypothetical protein AXG89_02695 [Burkholderia sp. PAMC 26561]